LTAFEIMSIKTHENLALAPNSLSEEIN
jgi:hypothetical protein